MEVERIGRDKEIEDSVFHYLFEYYRVWRVDASTFFKLVSNEYMERVAIGKNGWN